GYSTTGPGRVIDNTVFGNGAAQIEAHTGLVTDNVVYSQLNKSRTAIELDSSSTGTGNPVFGATYGIYVDGGSEAIDNLVYDVTSYGIQYSLSAPAAITGNTIYSSSVGIYGAEYYTG